MGINSSFTAMKMMNLHMCTFPKLMAVQNIGLNQLQKKFIHMGLPYAKEEILEITLMNNTNYY